MSYTFWRYGLLAFCGLFVVATVGSASIRDRLRRGGGGGEVVVDSLDSLKRLNREQLESLYSQGELGELPVGFVKGEVLVLTEMALPRANRNTTKLIWRGKHFNDEGAFMNQFTGFRAVHSRAYVDNSFFDNKPSHILEYPTNIPFFGNMRDELRQVGPDLYLSVVFERSPPNKFLSLIHI